MGELIIIMGVSGCGKTTVGRKLSRALATAFLEGDDFHPEANINKMTNGKPLTDEDRTIWMDNILRAVNTSPAAEITLACSALTSYVQTRLSEGTRRNITWIWLSAPYDIIAARLAKRENHFMPADLLKSQFAALSVPSNAIKIDISGSANAAVGAILETLSTIPKH